MLEERVKSVVAGKEAEESILKARMEGVLTPGGLRSRSGEKSKGLAYIIRLHTERTRSKN